MATLADVLKAIKELITVTEKVRENTERIAKLEEKVDRLNINMVEMRGDIKAILSHLKTEERMDTLESMFREHIEACEKAKA